MKNLQSQTSSYMRMLLHVEDEAKDLELRIPTFWNDADKQWIGAIKTPISHKLITATGDDSMKLQNNFNNVFSALLQDPAMSAELFGMFKPCEEWDKK